MIPDDAIRETWDDVYDKSVRLAALIEAHCKQTGEQYDAMIVLPRGGYYPGNIVSRELGFSAPTLLHASIGTYEDAKTERNTEFRTGQMPADEEVRGKNILVIDEVCDTGQTLNFLMNYLQDRGVGLVRSGVLHHKPSRSETGFVPDWTVEETDKWVVYPWEPHEQNGKSSVVRRR